MTNDQRPIVGYETTPGRL